MNIPCFCATANSKLLTLSSNLFFFFLSGRRKYDINLPVAGRVWWCYFVSRIWIICTYSVWKQTQLVKQTCFFFFLFCWTSKSINLLTHFPFCFIWIWRSLRCRTWSLIFLRVPWMWKALNFNAAFL